MTRHRSHREPALPHRNTRRSPAPAHLRHPAGEDRMNGCRYAPHHRHTDSPDSIQ
ncbi:hypothetical protein ACIP5Y_44190 [Nocardia sp. NPDC088792]|uniref:hypothetical protein n=1 Tax=Nocardia sp. NPDC088792 TaxID=3364332 RepID=UPI0037FCDB67